MKLRIHHLTPLLLLASVFPEDSSQPPAAPALGPVNVKAAAARIDRLIGAELQKHGIDANPVADDATFVRRAYLGIAGRIPTSKETSEFLKTQDQHKYQKLIDRLLDSPGYVSHMYNYWADILRIKTRLNNQISGEPYIHWLKQSLTENKPYDKMVRELLTAEGPAHKRGNGATGYLLRDRGMQLDNMANTVRIFMGTRLECAQCHNHPFDKWKQKDFYKMAAFTGGINYRDNLLARPEGVNLREVTQEYRQKKDRSSQRAMNQLLRGAMSGIGGSGTGVSFLPKDYKYKDGKPFDPIVGKAIFGEDVDVKINEVNQRGNQRNNRRSRPNNPKNKNRRRNNPNRGRFRPANSRQVYAEWVTAKDNPRFTKVIANRMWKFALGRALIEPVDNLNDETKPSNPKLMAEIEKLMADLNFDLKQFLRVVYNTKIYRREVTAKDVPADKPYHFPGPVLRRMTGEQIWDSMLTIAVTDIDNKIQPPLSPRAKQVYNQYEDFTLMTKDELRKMVDQRSLRFKDPEKFREMQRQRRAEQNRKRQADQRKRQAEMRDKQNALRKEAQPLLRALNKARRANDKAKVADLTKRLEAMGYPINRNGRNNRNNRNNRNRRGRGRGVGQLVRASDLQSPAPNGHFIRQFGQSDRDQIQTSHTDANVPQVLTLLNGFVENRVLQSPQSVLRKEFDAASTPKAKIRIAYLSILSREPQGRESSMWEADVKRYGDKAYSDLIWCLVNTHEFRFIR